MSRVLVSIGAVQILIMLVALVRSKVLSVLLGPAGFGLVSTIDQTMLSVMQLAHLSLPFTAMKFMARRHGEGHEPFERTYATFLRAIGGLALLAVLIVAGLLSWRPTLFGSDLASSRPLFYLALLGVPALMLNVLFINSLAAAQRGASSAMVNMLVLLALAAASILGVLVDGVRGLYVATVAVGAVTTVATAWYLRSTLGLRPMARGAGLIRELRESPEIISFAMLIYAAMSAYSLTMLATRYFVFDGLGAVGAGHLQALLGIALTVGAVMTPMNGYFLAPFVNRTLPIERKAQAANDFAALIVLLLLVGGVGTALFPRLVLTVLFSSEFAPAAGALYLFVAWQCLYQLVNVYLQLLIGLDDVAFFAGVTCLGYGCTAVLFPTLIDRFGLGGAAVALSVAMLIAVIAAAVRLRGKFSVGIRPLVWLRGGYCLGAIVLAGVLFTPASEGTVGGVAMRVGYLALALGLMLPTMQSSERALLTSLASRVRRRPAPAPMGPP
jgi:PST family polysaccharide transporter